MQDRIPLFAAASGALAALTLQRLLKAFFTGDKQSSIPFRQPTPHPEWSPPAPQPPPFDVDSPDAFHSIDPETTPSDIMYPLVISSVVPRPIAFISSVGPDGSHNLAPYSYFNAVGHSPPLVAIGFCGTKLREHGKKDSFFNILESGEFVVNIISEWFIESANHCCGNFPYEVDEMTLVGLTPIPSLKIAPPRIKESAIQLECVLRHTYDATPPSSSSNGQGGSTVVIAEVVMWHVAAGVAGKSPSGKLVVDVEKLKPMSRLGGNTYARTAGLFDLPRPDR